MNLSPGINDRYPLIGIGLYILLNPALCAVPPVKVLGAIVLGAGVVGVLHDEVQKRMDSDRI